MDGCHFSGLSWMAWTWPTAAFFAVHPACFIAMSVWEYLLAGRRSASRHSRARYHPRRPPVHLAPRHAPSSSSPGSAFSARRSGRRWSSPSFTRVRGFPLGVSLHALLPYPRHRPGHDLVAGHRLSTPICTIAAARSRSSRSTFPRPGWVEHDPEEIWASVRRDLQRRDRARPASRLAAIAAIGITNQRETTRDLGAQDRPSRSTAPSCGRTAAPPSACQALRNAGHEPGITRQDRASFSTPISPEPRSPGCSIMSKARARRPSSGELALRHRRQLPDLAADRRQGSRHRCHQCLAHAALRYPRRQLGVTSFSPSSRCRVSMLPEVQGLRRRFRDRPSPSSSAAPSRSAASPATSRRRPSAKPASRRA